jgi:flavin-dependent dehydrogenase
MNDAPRFDVLIVGMGPAGATLARLLPPQIKTAIIDRKSLCYDEDGFRKPCGGLLAPDAQKALARFSLSLPRELFVTPQIFAVKTIDIPSKITTLYQRFYLNMDRHKFDLWLASLIDKRVRIFEKSICTDIVREQNGFKVRIIRDGKEDVLYSRYLVGADGSDSHVRKLFFKQKIRQYTAIQQWFTEEHPAPFYYSFFDESITNCYAWGDSKDGHFILGAALPKTNCRANFEKLRTKLISHGFCFGEKVKTEACLVSRPASPFQFAAASRGVFLIGEAAGFISPSSLEGISYAMDSAFRLCRVLQKKPKHPELSYRLASLGIRLTLTLKLLKNIFMYFPPLRRLVMASGVLSVKERQRP